MPELPEVETARRRLEKALKGQKILKATVDEDDYVCYDEAEPREVARALTGAKVKGTGRRGKYFWLELDRKPWPILHLGMSGNIEIRRPKGGKTTPQGGWGGLTLYSSRAEPVDLKKPPRFSRLSLLLENGATVAITDPRRFGRIRLSEDPAHSPVIQRLGYDPLHDFPSAKILFEKLKRRRMAIKTVLLDQSVFAGVGNWIADEVLYQAGVAPHRLAADLGLADITKIRRKLLYVVETAVERSADYDRYPKHWLFSYRWGKTKNAQDYRGRPIMHETIGGRTAAWVPDVQF